jgi:cephalosporin hydroxylase
MLPECAHPTQPDYSKRWPEKITVDVVGEVVTVEIDGKVETFALSSAEAFAAISKVWLRSGWDAKHVYSFTWLGRPIIQLPEDLLRMQELVYQVKPDVIIETGIAHGGTSVFYASLCQLMGKGRVIGIDIEIRAHNRKALDEHHLRPLITLIEGSSISEDTVQQVRSLVKPGERVMVMLDSFHSYDHVLAELNAYAPLICPGSYVVAMDGITGSIEGAPRRLPNSLENNARVAARDFVRQNPNYAVVEPEFLFNEGAVNGRVTYYVGGIVKRLS